MSNLSHNFAINGFTLYFLINEIAIISSQIYFYIFKAVHVPEGGSNI